MDSKGSWSDIFTLRFEDCYQINQQHIEEAFRKLNQKDVVIGPTLDGGYYLLGMNTVHDQFFQNKKLQQSQVPLIYRTYMSEFH